MRLKHKDMVLTEAKERIVARKLQKACQTRWLLFDSAVSAAHQDLPCILLAPSELTYDVAAVGLMKKTTDPLWIGTLYILKEVLPLLSELLKTFYRGTVNFSAIAPMVAVTTHKLASLPEQGSAIQSMEEDCSEEGRLHGLTICSDLSLMLTDRHIEAIKKLRERYVEALVQNIQNRFNSAVPIIAAFDIFNPLSLPEEDSADFSKYGHHHCDIETLARHFYQVKPADAIMSSTQRLAGEFQLLKYHLGVLKDQIPKAMQQRSTEWCLEKLLSNPSYHAMIPQLMKSCRSGFVIACQQCLA